MFVDFDFFLLDLAKTATHNNFQKMKNVWSVYWVLCIVIYLLTPFVLTDFQHFKPQQASWFDPT